MKLPALLACVVLATAVSAVSVSAEEDKAPTEKEKVVCRTDKVTGSRAKLRRTCMTRSQWDELARKTKKGLDEFNSSAAGGTRPAQDNAGIAGMGGT